MSASSGQSLLYKYLVSGIIESGIVQDGGYICDQEIPSTFKYATVVFSLIFNIWLCNRIKNSYKFTPNPSQSQPTTFQFIYGIFSLITVTVQFFMKVSTQKGMFILNPCHTNLVFVGLLMILPTTRTTKLIKFAWEPWIFGPIFALLFPHLYGINQFEIYLYYVQHLLIFPFGQLLLTRRYGGTDFPSFKYQMFGFATMSIYQYALLTPLSDITKVNLNFTLCHSPADPGFDLFGYRYFFLGQIYLNLFSYIFLIFMWPIKKAFYWIFFSHNQKEHKD